MSFPPLVIPDLIRNPPNHAMKKKPNKYKPYVRRLSGNEKANDLITSYRLAFYFSLRPQKAYVLVQRGFPNIALAVGATKRDVKRTVAVVGFKVKSFKQWANEVKISARDAHLQDNENSHSGLDPEST
jgi:hypothetical protein